MRAISLSLLLLSACDAPESLDENQLAQSFAPCTGFPDGLYCSASLGLGVSKTLYHCLRGQTFTEVECPNACQVRPPGVPDRCQPLPSCPDGDGDYCASSLGFPVEDCNPPHPYCGLSIINDTLYHCKGGIITQAAICPTGGENGCQVRPPGQPDGCRAGTCQFGSGYYCGKGANIDAPPDTDPSVLYICRNGRWTRVSDCVNGCDPANGGEPAFCR